MMISGVIVSRSSDPTGVSIASSAFFFQLDVEFGKIFLGKEDIFLQNRKDILLKKIVERICK